MLNTISICTKFCLVTEAWRGETAVKDLLQLQVTYMTLEIFVKGKYKATQLKELLLVLPLRLNYNFWIWFHGYLRVREKGQAGPTGGRSTRWAVKAWNTHPSAYEKKARNGTPTDYWLGMQWWEQGTVGYSRALLYFQNYKFTPQRWQFWGERKISGVL